MSNYIFLSCIALVRAVMRESYVSSLIAVESRCSWTVWSDSYWSRQLWRWLGLVSA